MWVKGIVWHPKKLNLRLTVVILVDTGAGGGNYASHTFIRSIETNARNRETIMNKAGKDLLNAAIPRDKKVLPMNILGSADLPIVFPPDDRVHIVTVRVVDQLPYGLILGAVFLRKNESVISFAEGGSFRPTPGSTQVPFLSHGTPTGASGKRVKGWRARTLRRKLRRAGGIKRRNPFTRAAFAAMSIHGYGRMEQFAAVRPSVSVAEPDEVTVPSEVPPLKEAAWEDDCTLQWILYNAKEVCVEGSVSLEINAFVRGPQPQSRQLVLLSPLPSFDLKLEVGLGVARGVQWWYPHTPLKCKLVNVTKAPISL